MHSRALPVVVLAVGLLAASDPAQPAASSALDLVLEAPPECASASHVRVAVDALVHTAPARPLLVRAKIERREDGYLLEAQLGAGQRQVHGETCDAVTQALIAIAALAIDPSARLSAAAFPDPEQAELEGAVARADSASPEAAGLAADARPASPAPTPPDAKVEPGPPRARTRLLVGGSLLGVGEWGALPGPTYGASGLLRASVHGWSAELGGAFLQPRWVQVVEVSDRKGGYVSWLGLQANVCRWLGRFGAACGGFELGQMTGEGRGVANADIGQALWSAAVVGALGRLPLGADFSLEVRAWAAFPLYRPEFSVAPYRPLHQPSWISGRLSVGIGFR